MAWDVGVVRISEGVRSKIKAGEIRVAFGDHCLWFQEGDVRHVYNDGRLCAPRQELDQATGRVEFTAPAESGVVITSLPCRGQVALLGGETIYAIISGMAYVTGSNLLPWWYI